MATVEYKFKKRAGTSGISGHLYETKLISIILLKLLHDDDITEFYLASNMDEIGAFDDICLKAKVTGINKPILAFIQAKHKDDNNTYLNYDLIKNFHTSLVKVKGQLKYNNKYDNIFFKDSFDNIECLFILYTNAKYFVDSNNGESDEASSSAIVSKTHDSRRYYETEFADKLNDLIATSTVSRGCHLNYGNEELEYVGNKILEEEIATLAEHFAKFLNDNEKQSMNIMHDEYMLRYHVVIRQCVLDVSEIQSDIQDLNNQQKSTEDWRYATFQPTFFDTQEFFLLLFRNKIYEYLLKNRGNAKSAKKSVVKLTENLSEVNIDYLIASFLSDPSAIKLSYLIETYVIFTNGELKFLIERPDSDQEQLKEINILPLTVDEAHAIKFLRHLKLKVPVSFGNLDMTLKGNQKKIDKRLVRLASFLKDLCQGAEYKDSYQIVTVGEGIDEDYLSPSGGIGGAVGNLLVYDSATKLLKFTEDKTLLQKNSKALFDQLNEQISNLYSYRIEIKTTHFPKLVFDCTQEAKVILDKLLIYEKQSNQYGAEEILTKNIREYEESKTTQSLPTKPETIAVYYHHKIQQWWLSSKFGTYLTKTCKLYENAIKSIVKEPQLCALQNTYFNSVQNRIYVFKQDATSSFNSMDTFSNIIIITDVASLMVMKVIQCLRNKDVNKYTVLDLKIVLNLPIKDFRAINVELNETENTIIIVCADVEIGGTLYKRLLTIAKAVEKKQIMIVATKDFITKMTLDELMEYFAQINNVLEDEKIILTDFTLESQNVITENAKVVFQGQQTYLKSILQEALDITKGFVLNKIMNNETIVIGEPLSDTKYEEIKHLYVDRRLNRTTKSGSDIYVRNFNDIDQNYVLVTADPGMGKSVLLTHLSLKTKECDYNTWIMRINLLDHSKKFHDWQNSKMVINTLEVIKFLCQAIAKNKSISITLKEVNNKIFLTDCTADELITFELNLFLQFYNNGKLLLVFDGFDEICPHYKHNVLKLLNVVINFPQKNKMWVTSRPYNEILPDLEGVLGKSYKLEYITEEEKENYLNRIWKSMLALEKLNDAQLSNLISFADFILDKILTKSFPISMHFTLSRMYYLFYDFVQSLFNNDPIVLSADITKDMLMIEPVASTSTSDSSVSVKKLVDQLVGTPLLLFLVAEYFANIAINVEINKWELDINIIKIYESFIDTKFKNILFEEKNKIDVYKPDVLTRYEKDRDEFMTMHKKLAAYTVLKNKIFFDDCPLDEFKEIEPFADQSEFETMISNIKCGKEKTGLINHVALDNMPVFIHKTFGEYFSAEFLSDIFKSDMDFDHKKLLYTAICTYGSMDIRPWLNEKRYTDDNLNIIIQNIKSKKIVLLSWHRELFSRGDWGTDHLLKLLSSGPEDYKVDWCSNITEDFADTLNVLDPTERRLQIKRFNKYVISKMKPHLKQHFTGVLVLRGCRQMINWMGGKIDLP